ncbi:endopeptidase La [Vescimonas sp.]|uniref:endopeptidase La n=1 Tax=Vescimonas sp. TaxID=2892404 RepID=UPI003F81AC7D
METITRNMPVLALRGLTAFPGQTMSFDAERDISIFALDNAMENDRRLLAVTQRELSTAEPGEEELYTIGTVCHILQIIKTSDTTVRVIVEGECRARLHRLWQKKPFLQAQAELLPETESRHTARSEALIRRTYVLFGEYRELVGSSISDDFSAAVLDCGDTGRLADLITQNINLRHQDRQRVLEELYPDKRLRIVNDILTHEVDVLSLESEMEQKVRMRVAQVQKDMILREQVKVLQHELGDDGDEEIEEYTARIEAAHLPDEVHKKLTKEVERLAKQPFGSAEASVIRNYLDVCLELPWNKSTRERADVAQARKILDKEHYGLDKVKERVLEFIAVRQLNPDAKGKILCLVGPPGVGKTSVAMSVARAMNRKCARLSLGGVRDEADIRGHRKTYIGAMPGRIIEALGRAGTMNPLLVLDEIDKLASDMRGDPAAALLEVLDSEQNGAFRDHFVEVPVDLSRVMFITTANTTSTIPRPLLDRMEVIELGSYTDEEKLHIAREHLLPKQMKENGLRRGQLRLDDDALRRIITDYTRESGVRTLERQLGKLCRRAAMRLVQTDVKRIDVTAKELKDFLDTPPYGEDTRSKTDQIGVVNGLAWTEVGGELLEVEAGVMDGTGKLELTGNLGQVMQESVKAAYTCLRSRARELGIAPDFYKTKDIHVHFPEGAVPKDGPSAGIAITTAMLSALTGRAVRHDVAMTGEVTLRGRVLPIGGLREKTMAAKRNGITTVIIPKENEKDLADIDPAVRAALRFVTAETVDAVFAHALTLPKKEAAVEHLAVIGSPAMQEVRHGDQL